MTFNELTRVMLTSMDFFELRRTAARYGVNYQGVRRSKLMRDLEQRITNKNKGNTVSDEVAPIMAGPKDTKKDTAKPEKDKVGSLKINTYGSGDTNTRVYGK